jgi:hypothetical protein
VLSTRGFDPFALVLVPGTLSVGRWMAATSPHGADADDGWRAEPCPCITSAAAISSRRTLVALSSEPLVPVTAAAALGGRGFPKSSTVAAKRRRRGGGEERDANQGQP